MSKELNIATIKKELMDAFLNNVEIINSFRKYEDIKKTTDYMNRNIFNHLNTEEDYTITDKFIKNIEQVFCACGTGVPFGQANVQEWLSCSKSKATNVMNAMKAAKVINKVTGFGSGRYEFIEL